MKTYTPTEMARAVPIRVRPAVLVRPRLVQLMRLARWVALPAALAGCDVAERNTDRHPGSADPVQATLMVGVDEARGVVCYKFEYRDGISCLQLAKDAGK